MSQDNNGAPHGLRMLRVGGEDGHGHRDIAYIEQDGAYIEQDGGGPGLFWLSGFKSSMEGEKATALAAFATKEKRAITRMDYSGHGRSGGDFADGCISHWLEEALAVFDLYDDKRVLIGSSMGGWIALLLARLRPERIAGLVLIAPAWDMTAKLMPRRLTDEMSAHLKKHGWVARPSAYGDGDYLITQKLIDDGENHLIGDSLIKLGCPVHILHGKEDPDVPWQHGHALTALLPHDPVNFTLVPDGGHRLSRPQDIDLLIDAVRRLI